MPLFLHSGLAAVSDFQSPEWKILFAHLEKEQALFRVNEEQFRSTEYRWPRDALRNWSRVWEYPYVFRLLQHWREAEKNTFTLHVADLGSGVTFFPFAVARSNFNVTCLDVDPICQTDLERAVVCASADPGHVEFRLIENGRLPMRDGEADAVYCVSVLEHVPALERTVREMGRILRKGGLLLLTFDMDLTGKIELSVEGYRRLRRVLDMDFELLFPERTAHPRDVLQTDRGPFPMRGPALSDRPWAFLKEYVLKPLLRRPCAKAALSVMGLALRKRDA